ncbi:YscX family type III secretion protein [Vibrio sagamiensis]|uniref:Type III secretion protein, YscX family n=1 Tax=Vibrio sagamiensis NBRC 104589 TaxID=1219064 RepID=A0A511QDT5_9VIBR|nr:YscX family type III secretion protein [Vibrio sagamiensis]PNQ56198.1 YscX family type III secretion protein [Vibrio agarivorans]GEM75464.1 type III secretion protein, YscX family [Vibrio sagamiensis NBRC 104589]
MSKISTFSIGIEDYSYVSEGQLELDLPSRFQMLPDGQAIETHLGKLYELRPSDQYLFSLAKPKLHYGELLRPEKYRKQFDETFLLLTQVAGENKSPKLLDMLEVLKETQIDQRFLIMALSLLIQV